MAPISIRITAWPSPDSQASIAGKLERARPRALWAGCLSGQPMPERVGRLPMTGARPLVATVGTGSFARAGGRHGPRLGSSRPKRPMLIEQVPEILELIHLH